MTVVVIWVVSAVVGAFLTLGVFGLGSSGKTEAPSGRKLPTFRERFAAIWRDRRPLTPRDREEVRRLTRTSGLWIAVFIQVLLGAALIFVLYLVISRAR